MIRAGEATIDLLAADAVGFGGLGAPRHRFDGSFTYSESGLGARATVQSRGASVVEAGGGADDLFRFMPLTTFNLKAWVTGERLAPRSSLLKGTRFSFTLVNLADVRERVVDRFGITPLIHQTGYRDPIGRSLEVELRKKF